MIELTRLAKIGGPLTKKIFLSPDGVLVSDGSACLMCRGNARRVYLNDLGQFADLIQSLETSEAIALGCLRPDLPDHVQILTQDQLSRLNGAASPATIARTSSHIRYVAGRAALVLIDIDTKGMPGAVRTRIKEAGGYWSALTSVLPAMATVGRIVRPSTSTGISRTDTGDALPGSDGLHMPVLDGTDIERFLKTLHELCWLAGFGWHMVGVGGQLLDRSIVDRMVCAPERLVFEGPPVMVPPLAQDQASRRPVVFAGPPLDTKEACPPLRIVDQARLKDLKFKSAVALAPDRAKARDHFIEQHAERLAKRAGISVPKARRVVEKQCEGTLLPDVALSWDDAEFEGCTVADILKDPPRFVGATLADPLEGAEYGVCKAMVMRRADGTPWIHSFAHGRTVYTLRYDAAAIGVSIKAAGPDAMAGPFVDMMANADLAPDEEQRLKDQIAKKTGTKSRPLNAMLKAAREEQSHSQAKERSAPLHGATTDKRVQLDAPAANSERLPILLALDEVLGSQSCSEPPMRDADGRPTEARCRTPVVLYAMTESNTADRGAPMTTNPAMKPIRLPAPEMPLLTPHDEYSLSHLIEKHINFVVTNKESNKYSVALDPVFVRHYLKYRDSKLPVVTAIATSPLVLPDGTLLATQGLDRKRGIVFRLQPEFLAVLPKPEECRGSAVAEAMRFLTDEWLCDVSTDYAGKCILITAALTIIERAVLPERPAFFVTAGQRGGGKTTTLQMLFLAATGYRAPAAAWSSSEEERRKCLFSYLGEGVPAVVWDNIPRGSTISCSSIEKSLTAAVYSDRVLGETATRTVPSTTVNMFTGNNISPRGDMASRSLVVRLSVDQPDPENRKFVHDDPIAWTIAHWGNILHALYTIMLGNPRLRDDNRKAAETRFKAWWHLVGSAVENAAAEQVEHVQACAIDGNANCPAAGVCFRDLFLEGEQHEEQTSSLVTVLDALRTKYPNGFKAADLTHYLAGVEEATIELKAALEQASGKALPIITPTAVTWRLKALTDAPVLIDEKVWALRYDPDKSKNGGTFAVREIKR